MTETEKAQHLAEHNALIAKWNAMPRSEYRTSAIKTLNLGVKFLQGKKVPAWVADSFK